MNQQQDITRFESEFNGPFPFSSNGVLIGLPIASFAEEMQTMITFPGGRIDLGTLYTKTCISWWGDNVSEANYNLTFFKEGLATLGEFLFAARTAQHKAGGPGTPAGRSAFEASLRQHFSALYGNRKVFTTAPSDPTPYDLFSGASTYDRPGHRVHRAPPDRRTEGFRPHTAIRAGEVRRRLRSRSRSGSPRLLRRCPDRPRGAARSWAAFFRQWFDTTYPTSSGATRPSLTGPGLPGSGFTC